MHPKTLLPILIHKCDDSVNVYRKLSNVIIVIYVIVFCQSDNGYNDYKGGMIAVKEKKTEVITIRIPQKTKETIVLEAEKRDWSPSKMAEKVLSAWADEIINNNIEEE